MPTIIGRDFNLLNVKQSELDAFSANIVSLLQAGCFFGSLAAGPFADKFGRKYSVIAAGLLFFTGSSMQTWAYGSIPLMFTGRAIGGLVCTLHSAHRSFIK